MDFPSRWASGPAGRLARGQPNVPLGSDGGWGSTPVFWVVLGLTGVGAGLGGAALTLLLHAVQHLSFGYTEAAFLQGVQEAGPRRREVVLALAGVVVGAGGWALVRWFRSSPGVSETLWLDGRTMGLRATAAAAVLQIVTVGMGSSLGREAAPKELGAVIGQHLARRAGLSPEQVRVLLAAGAGAGMAGVYDVPLGGGLFAAEVLLGSLALPVVVPVLAASAVGTVVAWVVVPREPVYLVPGSGSSVSLLVWAVLFGPVAGVVAAALVRGVAHVKAHRPRGWRLPATAVPVFTGLGVLATAYPEVLGNGKGPTQLAFDGTAGLGLLAALVVLKPVATLACLRAGASGGLFTPVLATGAVLGGVTGHLWVHLWPGAPLGVFAVVGGGALLAAATQGPVSAIVLVVELTGSGPGMLLPLLVAALGAVVTARRLEDRSIYTATFPRRSDPLVA